MLEIMNVKFKKYKTGFLFDSVLWFDEVFLFSGVLISCKQKVEFTSGDLIERHMNVCSGAITQRLKFDRKIAVVFLNEFEKQLFRIRIGLKTAVRTGVVRLVKLVGTLNIFFRPFLRIHAT